MPTLEEDMLAQSVPQAPQQQQQQLPDSMSPLSDTMSQLQSGDPLEDFITTLMRVVETKGLDMNEIMGQEDSTEDSADLASDPDPMEMLSEQEIMLLVEKFMALPPDQQSTMEREFSKVLPPKTVNRMKAALRFAQQRGAGAG